MNLGQGFPDWDPPAFVAEEVERAMREGHNQYTRSSGHPLLTAAVAEQYSAVMDRTVDPTANVCVTAGTTGGLFSTMHALLEPGDEAIVIEPCYDSYAPSITMAGGSVIRLALKPRAGSSSTPVAVTDAFSLDAAEIAATLDSRPQVRVLLLNTPHNPTGKVRVLGFLNT